MKRRMILITVAIVAISLISLNTTTWGEEAPQGAFDSKNFSATLTFASDYVFRGISQTDENFAIQGSFDYSHPVGLYLGVWASNVDDAISEANIEIDYYIGYRRELFKNFGMDITAFYYSYPSNEKELDPEFFEAHLGLSYALSEVMLSPTFGIGYNYSPDFFGEDGAAHFVNVTASITLPYEFNIYGELGYQTVEGDKATGNRQGLDGEDGFDYSNWKIGVSKMLLGFKLDLNYQGVSEEEFFGEIGEARAVFLISRTF